jgi:inner membrane protein
MKWITFVEFEEVLIAQNISYSEIETKPTPFNTLLWSANVKADEVFYIAEYSIFDTQPIEFRPYPKQHHKIDHLRDYDNLNRLINVTQGWYTISEKEDDLYLNDLRFGLISLNPESEKFAFSYLLQEKDNELLIEEEPKTRGDAQELFADLWNRLKGN